MLVRHFILLSEELLIFANGIVELATVAGADVIVDDVIYFAEPMFQDGVIAQAVDSVAGMGCELFFIGREQWQQFL